MIIITTRRNYASAVLGVTEPTGDIFIPHEMAILLVFCHQHWLVGDIPLHLKWALEVTHPLKNRSRRQISA